MGLTIKNQETYRLARELAAITGESLTVVVTEAVRERLDRVRRAQAMSLADRLLAIGRDCAAHLKEPYRSADHADLLYGELLPFIGNDFRHTEIEPTTTVAELASDKYLPGLLQNLEA
jgi:antitoxin VapB